MYLCCYHVKRWLWWPWTNEQNNEPHNIPVFCCTGLAELARSSFSHMGPWLTAQNPLPCLIFETADYLSQNLRSLLHMAPTDGAISDLRSRTCTDSHNVWRNRLTMKSWNHAKEGKEESEFGRTAPVLRLAMCCAWLHAADRWVWRVKGSLFTILFLTSSNDKITLQDFIRHGLMLLISYSILF